MSKTAPSTAKAKFKEGEKLLCYHGPLLYEAKCIKIKLDSSSNYSYFVHYQGWNKNLDEWVNDTRILKADAEHLELKLKLFKDHAASLKEKFRIVILIFFKAKITMRIPSVIKL